MPARLDLVAAELRAQSRSDAKFIAGLDMLRLAEKMREAGKVKDYFVVYCFEDPEVVDHITWLYE